jgi:putative ATP-dependent endonuclease of OLD family
MRTSSSMAQKAPFGWALLQTDASMQDESPNQGFIPHASPSTTLSPFAAAIYDLLATGASIVAIDEPEAHLHPSSQRSLAKMLKASSGQKILVTHSPTIAGSFEPDEIIVIRADGTASQSRRNFLSGDAGMLARWWIGRQLEPLTAEAVIAVEGPSDRIIVDAVSSALGFDLDGHDIVVMETNGCGDMKVVESIFGPGGFGIPLFELIDEDAMDDAAKRLGVDAADLEARSVFVSSRDLEDEYVRAIGAERLWTRMKAAQTFSRTVLSLCKVGPDGIPTESDLAEFIRSKSNRKIPSALLAAELIDETNAHGVSSVAKLLRIAWQ